MQAGTLDRPITLKNPVYTRNSFGELIKTYSSTEESWASLSEVTGLEADLDHVQDASQVAIFTIRYTTFVTEESIVTFNSTNYKIISVKRMGRNDYLQLITQINKDF